jgi:hypothetical protein
MYPINLGMCRKERKGMSAPGASKGVDNKSTEQEPGRNRADHRRCASQQIFSDDGSYGSFATFANYSHVRFTPKATPWT